MGAPRLTIDLEQLEKNTQAVVSFCSDYGIEVTGVTKAVCGMPQAAKAMIRGGVKGIGESRLENIARLRSSGVNESVMLLRIPPITEVDEIVSSVDISLNSELSVLRALSEAALRRGVVHNVILMVDLGDLREGIWPDDILHAVHETIDMSGIEIKGIGTNLTCYGGVLPSEKNMQMLADWAKRIEDNFSRKMHILSGGNSSSLPLIRSGKMPKEINHLRIGEAILLGRETVFRKKWPGTSQKVFLLSSELIEVKTKPSVPIGDTGEDAFGKKHEFTDKGDMRRGILNVGREDVDVSGLTPLEKDISILGASSDHLLVDLTESSSNYSVGKRISFIPNYSALLASMTSSYVLKKPVNDESVKESNILFYEKISGITSDREWRIAAKELGYNPVCLKNNEEYEKSAFSKGARAVIKSSSLASKLSEMRNTLKSAGLIWISDKPSLGKDGLLKLIIERGIYEGWLETENIVLLGIQHAEKKEREIINSEHLSTYTMEDVDLINIRQIMHKALRKTSSGTYGLTVYYNPDVSDKGVNGFTDRETHLIMEMTARSGLLKLFAVEADILKDNMREKKIKSFILSALGKRILDY